MDVSSSSRAAAWPSGASPETIAALNRVLAMLRRSFPQFMRYAEPYIPPGRGAVMETFQRIVAEQDGLARRVNDAVIGCGGLPDGGRFAIEFTDTHDLGIDFLIREAIGYQRQDIGSLEQCVEALQAAPAAQRLAVEARDLAQAHLQSLESLATNTAPSTTVRNGARTFQND